MIKVFTDLFFFSLQIQNREYYHYAQVDFDFGQVHVVWWLSYGQGGEKISVEPWNIWNVLIDMSSWNVVNQSWFITKNKMLIWHVRHIWKYHGSHFIQASMC